MKKYLIVQWNSFEGILSAKIFEAEDPLAALLLHEDDANNQNEYPTELGKFLEIMNDTDYPTDIFLLENDVLTKLEGKEE